MGFRDSRSPAGHQSLAGHVRDG
ncbi:hypothetical protein LINGRAHAP2_LOCUS4492 [Linum grandiflorum]